MFLTQEDYLQAIRSDQLQQLIENEPERLRRAGQSAMAEISSYLNAAEIYDTEKIFSEPRNEYLVTLGVDIMLYHLHKGIVPRNIPQVRITAYEQAIAWLEAVATGKRRPDLPLKEAGTVQSSFSFLSNHSKQDWYF